MFRRRWSGLPAEPIYPETLSGLGYFVNEDDEIRSKENENNYFKYFMSKNMRYNERQRFAMNAATENIVHKRLEALGLQKTRLPQTADPTDPHVPIYATPDLSTASRVVLIVGESVQELGILAHRVTGGPGGINKGSLVNPVRQLRQQRSSPDDEAPPAIVLANIAQLFWWPEGKKPLTPAGRQQIPCTSAAHWGVFYDAYRHAITGHEDALAHLATLFSDFLLPGMKEDASLQIVGLGDGAEFVERFLDNENTWATWGRRMQSLAIVGGFYDADEVKVPAFGEFLRRRARSWIVSSAPLDTPIASWEGNEESVYFTRYGCPVFSSGTEWLTELMFIDCQSSVLAWLQQVADCPGYANNEDIIEYGGPKKEKREVVEWGMEDTEVAMENENNGAKAGETWEYAPTWPRDAPPQSQRE